jgi:3-hydroxypropanoate dehydrogenase
LIEPFAFRNGTLQGAYLMFAARAIGLDTGPMSGFKNAEVDEAFFKGTDMKSNFLCALGYADETGIFQRLPRLPFDEACQIL